jgi:hypothetical protein
MRNYYVNYHSLQPGDRIVVPKSHVGMIQHHAIYIGYDLNGTHWIIDNNAGVGVRLITVDAFFRDSIGVTRIERLRGNSNDRKIAVQKALQKIGQPYNLINYNCEAFANEIQHGTSTSKQVEMGFGILAGVALLALLGAALSDEE